MVNKPQIKKEEKTEDKTITIKGILFLCVVAIITISLCYGLFQGVRCIEDIKDETKLQYKLEKDVLCHNLGYSYSSYSQWESFECLNNMTDFIEINRRDFERFYESNNKTELINKYKAIKIN